MLRNLLRMLGAAALLAATAGATAQQATPAPPPELLGKLTGRWVLTGTIAGQPTTHDVEADWALQRSYVRIYEASRERNAAGAPEYEAIIYVGWLRDHYVCLWLDNTEVASGDITCVAAPQGDVIPFEFRDRAGTLSFVNRFVYRRADDSWEWQMDNIRDGQPVPFGRVTLRRP